MEVTTTRRGTTPTVTLAVDTLDLTTLQSIYVTFRQGAALLTKRSGEDGVTVEPHRVTVRLSQADTLAFRDGRVQVQLRALAPDGTALASGIATCTALEILLDGEIS